VPEFPGLHHVALTVTDIRASAKWYERLLGSKPVLDEDVGGYYHIVFAIPGGTVLALHDHGATDENDRFSEYRVGLDHVSFGVTGRAELAAWEQRLNDLGIEHGGIVDARFGSGISFRDPDNIALEIFSPPT
jgi:glyoxylase I family protein